MFFNKISYSLFLMHMMMIVFIDENIGRIQNPWDQAAL
jgi:peptidoglycan/LPS O-acetylase OafA/YrhL